MDWMSACVSLGLGEGFKCRIIILRLLSELYWFDLSLDYDPLNRCSWNISEAFRTGLHSSYVYTVSAARLHLQVRVIYFMTHLCSAGGIRLDKQESNSSCVGKDDSQHHRYHTSCKNSPERRGRGHSSYQYHPISHGHQFEYPKAWALCGRSLDTWWLLLQGCEAHCTCKGNFWISSRNLHEKLVTCSQKNFYHLQSAKY